MTMQSTTVQPTADIKQAKDDLHSFGFCLLKNVLSAVEIDTVKSRLMSQAAAEKTHGEAFEDGGANQQWGAFVDDNGRVRRDAFREQSGGVNQRVWMLVNKGAEFNQLLAHEQVLALVNETLGEEKLLSSFSANIAKPGGIAMPLHTDQWWMPEPIRRGESSLPVGSMTRSRFTNQQKTLEETPAFLSPAACTNVIWMLDDFTTVNGATQVVPGSHLAGRHPDPETDKDVKTISACGPAGTALITDGRVWHGTGANTGTTPRHAVLATFCGPQFRPQENFVVGTKDDVVKNASPQLLALLGFKVWWGYGRTGHPTVELIDRDETLMGVLYD